MLNLTHKLKISNAASAGQKTLYVIQEKNKKTGEVDYCCSGFDEADCECGAGEFWWEDPFYKNIKQYTENKLEYAKHDLEMWRNGMRSEDYTFKIVKLVIDYKIEDIESEVG